MRPVPAPERESINVTMPTTGLKDLASALREETALIESLIGLLERQRKGIAQHDLEVIDETVHGSQRILLTLSEARKRRRRLVQITTGAADDDAVPDMTKIDPKARDAWGVLQNAAKRLSDTLSVNQSVLREAIRFGQEYVRTVFQGLTEDPAAYDRDARSAGEASGSVLFNARV